MSKTNQKNIEMIDRKISELLKMMDSHVMTDECKEELENLTSLRQQLTSSGKDEVVGKVTGDQVVRSIITVSGLVGIIGFEQFGGIITTRALSLISKGLGGGA